jgi:hypothetical protein
MKKYEVIAYFELLILQRLFASLTESFEQTLTDIINHSRMQISGKVFMTSTVAEINSNDSPYKYPFKKRFAITDKEDFPRLVTAITLICERISTKYSQEVNKGSSLDLDLHVIPAWSFDFDEHYHVDDREAARKRFAAKDPFTIELDLGSNTEVGS